MKNKIHGILKINQHHMYEKQNTRNTNNKPKSHV